MHKNYRGFSLVEMLIAVAIIGILAAFVMSSNESNMQKTRRAAAKVVLLDIQGKQERASITKGKYQALSDLDAQYGNSLLIDAEGNPTSSSSAFYRIEIPADDLSDFTFVITATPVNAQTKDSCGTLTVNQNGDKTASGSGSCW